MGWTGIYAKNYTSHGKIDRKAECDDYFLEGLNRGFFDVHASRMVGSTYYAAVSPLKTVAYEADGSVRKDSNGNTVYEDIPKENRQTFAAVILTQTDKDMFYYKEMSETEGPRYYDCPMSILKKLSPTDNEWANEWRARCLARANKLAEARKQHVDLPSLPIGSVIRFEWNGEDKWLQKCAPNHQFKTAWWKVAGEHKYFSKKRIPKDYEVVQIGGLK